MRTYRGMERRGPGPIAWIIAGIIVLSVGGIAATIVISVQNDVASGYIPPDERRRPVEASPPDAPRGADAVTPGG